MTLGCISTALPPPRKKNQCPPSPPRSTRTASEKPLADRPTAAGHPVGVKATQTAAFVAMQGPELYQYSRNGYRPAVKHELTRSSNVDRIVRRNDR